MSEIAYPNMANTALIFSLKEQECYVCKILLILLKLGQKLLSGETFETLPSEGRKLLRVLFLMAGVLNLMHIMLKSGFMLKMHFLFLLS